MKYRLKENHPTLIKYQKLIDFMDELGITVNSSGILTITDHDKVGTDYYISDQEDGRDVTALPYFCESTLTFYKSEKSKFELEKEAAQKAIDDTKNKIDKICADAKKKGLTVKKNQFSAGWTIDLPGGYYLATDDDDMISYVKGY